MDGQLETGFFKTDKAGKNRGSHYHTVYINQQARRGEVSFDMKHTHQLEWPVETGAADPAAAGPGLMQGSPGIPGQQQMPLQPALGQAPDGHTHNIGPEIDAIPKIDEDDADVVADVRSLFDEALENESDYRKRGEESEDFYSGFGQWDKAIKDKLKTEDRAALTINEIEPKLDILSGHQRQNRLDIKFYPVEEGDATTADILNVLVKNILEQSNYEHEETESFEDSMVTGRGNIEVRVDYQSNVEGDIKVEWYPWKQVTYGPHQRKDLQDLDYLVKHQWHNRGFIKNMWPEKAAQIEAEYDMVFNDKDTHERVRPDQFESPNAASWQVSGKGDTKNANYVDIAKKRFRVVECWRRVPRTVKILVNAGDGVYKSTEFWAENDIRSASTISSFNVVPVKKHRMRVTTIINHILLEDDYPDLAKQDFHIIPIYAKKRGIKVWGKVDSAKDPQREINKRHSQAVDILNRMAAYGWFYDDQTFLNLKEQKNFETNSARAGFLQKIRDIKNVPLKVEGTKFPNELANYEALASAKIKEIMNVNTELLGQQQGESSGIAIVRRQRQGLIGNEFLFDNLSLAKRKLGRMIAAYIQKVYDVDRMIRILENQASRGSVLEPPQVPPGSQMEKLLKENPTMGSPQYDPAVLKELLANVDLTKYDVACSESAYSPTNRQGNFIVWLEAAKVGVQVPPEVLVDLSDLPDKEKVKASMIAMQRAKAEEAEKTRQVELIKSGVNPQSLQPLPGQGPAQGGGK